MQAHDTIGSELNRSPVVSAAEKSGGYETRPAEQPQAIGVEFLSNLAHQLRSPLSSLRVWVDLLGDTDALSRPEDVKRLVEGIGRATGRLERQISDVLEVGYLEAGTLTFEKGPVNAAAQAIQAVSEAEHAASSRRLTFELELSDEHSVVNSSEPRLQQIISCLLSNAVRFSPVDGTIRVTGGPTPRIAHNKVVTTILEPTGQWDDSQAYYICVSDDGPGIPENMHQEIFRPFQRAVRKGAHGGGGSGLGLALVHGLIRLHGGGVWLQSAPGEGSRFEFGLAESAASDGA